MKMLLVCIFILVSSMSALPDMFLKYKKTTSSYAVAGQIIPEKAVYASSWIGKSRAWYNDGENGCFIFDYKANKLFIMNNASKSFSVIPLDNMASMVDKAIEENASGAEEAGEMKEMMKGMMGAMAAGMQMTVTPTSEKKKIGSWDCFRYNVTMTGMGESTSEIWATNQIKVDPAVFNNIRNAMMATMPGFDKIIKESQKIKGIPVLTRSLAKVMNAEVRSEEQLIEHVEKTSPAGIFEIPKGYREAKGLKNNNDDE